MIAVIAALYGAILTLVVQALRAQYRRPDLTEDPLRATEAPTQAIADMWPGISPLDVVMTYMTVEERPDGRHLVWRSR